MAYFNGTQIINETFDYMIWGQNDALHGKSSQVGSIPAAFQSSYTDGYNYGSTVMKQNINKVQM